MMMKAICKEVYKLSRLKGNFVYSDLFYYASSSRFISNDSFNRVATLIILKRYREINSYNLYNVLGCYEKLPKYYTRAIYESENFLNQLSENADLCLLMTELARKDLVGFLKLITNKSARKNKEFIYLFRYYIIQSTLLSLIILLVFWFFLILYKAITS